MQLVWPDLSVEQEQQVYLVYKEPLDRLDHKVLWVLPDHKEQQDLLVQLEQLAWLARLVALVVKDCQVLRVSMGAREPLVNRELLVELVFRD